MVGSALIPHQATVFPSFPEAMDFALKILTSVLLRQITGDVSILENTSTHACKQSEKEVNSTSKDNCRHRHSGIFHSQHRLPSRDVPRTPSGDVTGSPRAVPGT
jgi:hypothetical protein